MKVVNSQKETVDERIERILREGAEEVANHFIECFDMTGRLCESPMEKLLAVALYSETSGPEGIFLHHMSVDLENNLLAGPRFPNDPGAIIFPQSTIGPYRVDFAIWDRSHDCAPPRWIVVEVDGHDYHERTKAQARRDKQRDRYMAIRGIRVLRFTGSEVYADPDKCVAEILENLLLNEWFRNK